MSVMSVAGFVVIQGVMLGVGAGAQLVASVCIGGPVCRLFFSDTSSSRQQEVAKAIITAACGVLYAFVAPVLGLPFVSNGRATLTASEIRYVGTLQLAVALIRIWRTPPLERAEGEAIGQAQAILLES